MKSAQWNPVSLLAALLAVLFAGAVPKTMAKAAYYGADKMIEEAEMIAIVTITRVAETKAKGAYFSYSEVAHAKVEETLKGTLPATVKLHGGESFICAQVHYAPGRYLVFLRRSGDLITGCNWHLGVRPIKKSKVEWLVPGEVYEFSWKPVHEVVELIRESTAKPKGRQ